ncbi:MAG: phage tail tip lysozyme [Firmicutes bacterium]|nr:phage tail tip lysozyme [Bacillota bacterium]
MATKTNTGLVAYAKAQVGLPYWYGTYGQTANASLLSAKKKQYPDYYTADDFKSQYGKRVHDCCGLIKGYLWSDSATSTPTYKSSQDKSANGLYTAATTKGKISTFPKTAGLLVFRGTSTTKITHVGVYGGDGYVYEAKNHASGVCKTAYKQSDWNYWAQCSYITDDTATASSTATTSLAAQTTAADEKTVWDYFYGKIGNAYGVAGLMGNLYAESALIANNLQNTYNTKLGMTDKEYTDAVDSGTYTAFSSDSAGYGLAQWTYSTRKKALQEYAVSQKASVGNLSMQLAFLYKEMSESYSTVLNTLKNATSVLQASNIVLTKYEKPADTGTSVQTKRAGYGQTYYDKYAGTSSSASTSSTSSAATVTEQTATDPAKSFNKSLAGTYKTTANLYMRNGAGQGKAAMVVLPKGTSVKNYGYYTAVSGVKWLYVQVTYNNIKYTGFCCGTYLKKQ